MNNQLWKEVTRPNILMRGWHMLRNDIRQDFAEELYSVDSVAVNLEVLLEELSKRIKSNTIHPQPLMPLEVPKGSLGFRPGSLLPIEDRIVLNSIVYVLAETLDGQLPDSVYSWRLKQPIPKNGGIFAENTVANLPFLKKKTFSIRIDPFTPWYASWPEFDEVSRSFFKEEGYEFMATTDISAYFENIQLPILRDLLLQLVPEEPQLINMLCHLLESWAERTSDGRPHFRGIPQGNSASSFLGNVFLIPLDNKFDEICKKHELRYFRYMDDARIFAKDYETARIAILEMTRILRQLHLNVQTAKTKVFHGAKEIHKALIDKRADEITEMLEEIKTEHGNEQVPDPKRHHCIDKLHRIAEEAVDGRQSIYNARAPLEGISVRVFSRWITAHNRLDSHIYTDRLIREISTNPDHRITRRLKGFIRQFPEKTSVPKKILSFLKSNKNLFPHQEAECLSALRYSSRIPNELALLAWKRVLKINTYPYLKMQACYLLSRSRLRDGEFEKLQAIFHEESSPQVQCAIAGLLVQRRKGNSEIVQQLVSHPNPRISKTGKFFQAVKNTESIAIQRLQYIFEPEVPWRVCDNLSLLHLMALSEVKSVKLTLKSHLESAAAKNHPLLGIRETLAMIHKRVEESLASAE